MSALDERWADVDPETLADAALEAPRCQCERPILDGDDCGYCGREIRAEGSLSREFRCAPYSRQLRWARGAGLSPRMGFRGLHREVGCNPALGVLRVALEDRLAELPAIQGDPFAEDAEPVSSLLAA